MKKQLVKYLAAAGILLAVALGGGSSYLSKQTAPAAEGPARYFRFRKPVSLRQALGALQDEKFLQDARAMYLLSLLRGQPQHVAAGTYLLKPGDTSYRIFANLRHPLRPLVRIPEQNWARRTAHLLENKGLVKADDYLRATQQPEAYVKAIGFPLEGSDLEGYLFGDSYEIPPLSDGQEVVLKQLKAFEQKVWNPLGKPKSLYRALIVGSMIELEVLKDNERPIVAGVIENRLRLKMPLQIDATVNFARQKWGRLTFKDIREAKSPYNTYLNAGLPPGPICSPSLKSVRAALSPATHPYLYYVAMPDGHHEFAATLAQHEHNVRQRKLLLKQAEGGTKPAP